MMPCAERQPYTIPLPALLVKVLEGSRERRILEVGCGYGRACFFLHEKGFKVVGVDLDRAQIALAQKETRARGVRRGVDFVLNDAGTLCFPDCLFDGVSMLGVLTLVSRFERP